MRALKLMCLAFLSSLSLASVALAQITNPTSGGNLAVPVSTFGNREWMTVLILLFGILIVLIEFLLLRGRKTDKVDDLGKYLVITVIIIGTLALMVGSIDNNQTAPAVGLFGTIAGYLLGRSDRAPAPPHPPIQDDGEEPQGGTQSAQRENADGRRAA